MQENLPEVPTVNEINKFPWASLAKYQWGIMLMMLSYIIFAKVGLPEIERAKSREAELECNTARLNDMTDRVEYLQSMVTLRDRLRLKEDTLNNFRKRVDSIMPPAYKVLKQNDR